MIERPDCRLPGYEHRKESGTWKEPRCETSATYTFADTKKLPKPRPYGLTLPYWVDRLGRNHEDVCDTIRSEARQPPPQRPAVAPVPMMAPHLSALV